MHVGYTQIDADGNEIKVFGDTWGQCVKVPDEIDTPIGRVGPPQVDVDYGGHRLVARFKVPGELQVIAERDRRLALGFDFDFNDARGVHRIGTTSDDMDGWDEVTAMAQAAINKGVPQTAIDIVTDTGPVAITAMEWQDVLFAAALFRQPIWAKSFVLAAMTPVPEDYASEPYWS